MVKRPEISVVMTLYREETNWVKEAIGSVVGMTFNYELIIVLDDKENKELLKLVNEIKNKNKKIKLFINEKRGGAAKARNKAIENSKGKYIAILDGDDVSINNRFEKQYKYLENHKKTDIVFSWVLFIDSEGKEIKKFHPQNTKTADLKNNLFKEHLFVHSSMFGRSVVFKKIRYDPKLLRSQDFDFWVRALAKGYKMKILEKYLTKYRISQVEDYNTRINKVRDWTKYGRILFEKNEKYFQNNKTYKKILFKYKINDKIYSITPNFIIVPFLKVKDKIQK